MSAPLPDILAEIAAAAGEDAALAIADARGGTMVYIPPAPDAEHWLTRLVGLPAALAIADRLTCGVGGMRVELPLGAAGAQAKMRAKVDALIAQGCSERDIALATRYTIRGIRLRKAKLMPGGGLRKDNRQLPLF